MPGPIDAWVRPRPSVEPAAQPATRRRSETTQLDLYGQPVSERAVAEALRVAAEAADNPVPLELLVATGEVSVRSVEDEVAPPAKGSQKANKANKANKLGKK